MQQPTYSEFIEGQFNADFIRPWLNALGDAPEVSVRINRAKLQKFSPEWVKSEIPFCADGFILKSRPWFAGDPLFHAGAYYVQDSSSMAIGETVRLLKAQHTGPLRVLDLCASPGGKSTHIASLLDRNDWLVANEVIGSRVNTLIENLCKWGFPNFTVTSADAKLIGKNEALFDLIVADMPCSGEGMFRKNPKAVEEWSAANVDLCAQRQKRIAHDVWSALKPGGYFIYSTCTFNKDENEYNVQYLCQELGAMLTDLDIPALNTFKKTGRGMFRLFPPDVQGEGLFFCVLQKPDSRTSKTATHKDSKKQAVPRPVKHPLLASHCSMASFQNQFHAFHQEAEEQFLALSKLPSIKCQGFPAGKDIRNELKPFGYLPLMQGFNQESLPLLELELSEALNYLSRDVMQIKPDLDGLTTLTYQGTALGLVQKNGPRINNLWPIDWRLRNKQKSSQP